MKQHHIIILIVAIIVGFASYSSTILDFIKDPTLWNNYSLVFFTFASMLFWSAIVYFVGIFGWRLVQKEKENIVPVPQTLNTTTPEILPKYQAIFFKIAVIISLVSSILSFCLVGLLLILGGSASDLTPSFLVLIISIILTVLFRMVIIDKNPKFYRNASVIVILLGSIVSLYSLLK